jgi:hypothetical protein
MNTATKTNKTEAVEAYCDCCSNEARADKLSLENCGWYVGANEQFCPNCND